MSCRVASVRGGRGGARRTLAGGAVRVSLTGARTSRRLDESRLDASPVRSLPVDAVREKVT